MHHRVDQPVAEELLLHVIEDLLPPGRLEADPVIGDDGVRRVPERLPCLIAGEVPGGDVERLKEALLDLPEEFLFTGREHGFEDIVGVLVRRAVVSHPDIGIRLVHRVEFDLLQSRRRPHREVDERPVEDRVVLLDHLHSLREVEPLEEPEPGLRDVLNRDLRGRRGRGKRGRRKRLGEEFIKLRYNPGVIDKVELALVPFNVQLLDLKCRTLREDQVGQVPEFVDRHHTGRNVLVGFGLFFHLRVGETGRGAVTACRDHRLVSRRRPGVIWGGSVRLLLPPRKDAEGVTALRRRGRHLRLCLHILHRLWGGRILPARFCTTLSNPLEERPGGITIA